jgi:hypothetical protein
VNYTTRFEIAERLKADLDNAHAVHALASAEFTQLIKHLPSGIPQVDGQLKQLGRASTVALQCYMAALRRYSDFVLDGDVPEELLPHA